MQSDDELGSTQTLKAEILRIEKMLAKLKGSCLLYKSDAADE